MWLAWVGSDGSALLMRLHSSSLDSAYTSLCSCAASAAAAAAAHPHGTLHHHAPADRILRAHAPIPTFGSRLRFWTAQIAARIRFTCCKDGSSPCLPSSHRISRNFCKKTKKNFHIFRPKKNTIVSFDRNLLRPGPRKSKIDNKLLLLQN